MRGSGAACAAACLAAAPIAPAPTASARARAEPPLAAPTGTVRLTTPSPRASGPLRAAISGNVLSCCYFWSFVSPSGASTFLYPLFAGRTRSLGLRLPPAVPPGQCRLAANWQDVTENLAWVSRPFRIGGKDATAAALGDHVTPFSVYRRQNMLGAFASGVDGTGQTVGVYESSDVLRSDLATFDQLFGLPAPSVTLREPSGNPGVVKGGSSFESTLDIEWLHAMAPRARIEVYLYKKYSIQSIKNAIENASERRDAAFSSSWSQKNFIDSSETYLRKVEEFNDATVSLAAEQGLCVIAAAGDHGEVDPATANGRTHFSWPAANRNVVAVGGTRYTSSGGEAYWSSGKEDGVLWAGAWGCTDIPQMGPWQTRQWGDLGVSGADRYVPDVAFVATDAVLARSGKLALGQGTSLSAPCWAGMWTPVQEWYRHGHGQQVPVPAPQALYDLAWTTTLPPAYEDQAAGAAALYSRYIGFGSPNVTNMIFDLPQIQLGS